ncbi:hypothetical protein OHS59_43750 [Streptomyces sp. NBC_00414]|uniref:hypothetical protein n=1 Tax=Streptomyces sp. NBC_00414 TaxID=2975739 RepID=UPI002E21033A
MLSTFVTVRALVKASSLPLQAIELRLIPAWIRGVARVRAGVAGVAPKVCRNASMSALTVCRCFGGTVTTEHNTAPTNRR